MSILVTLGAIALFIILVDVFISIDIYITEKRLNKMIDNSEKIQKMIDEIGKQAKEVKNDNATTSKMG